MPLTGGGIYAAGPLTATEVVLKDNTAVGGAGIRAESTVDLTDVFIWNNRSELPFAGGYSEGGGIFLGPGAVAQLERVTLLYNNASSGGAIYHKGSALTITNSTLEANTAWTSGGGAIAVAGAGVSNISMVNATIVGNWSNFPDGAGAVDLLEGASTLDLVNTILSNSTPQCGVGIVVVSFGSNLEYSDTCGLTGAGDLVNTPPSLGPLRLGEGFTPSRSPLPGSAAIDRGNDIAASTYDQRGVQRPLDGDWDGQAVSDIGAVEFDPPFFYDGFESGDTTHWSTATR